MNTVTKLAAAGAIALTLGAGATACASQPQQVHVLQYGYYNPSHVWVSTPGHPYYVYVSKSEYNSHKNYYSTPGYATTYTKTHTVTTVNKGYSVSSDGKTISKSTTTTTTKTTKSTGTKSTGKISTSKTTSRRK